MARVERGREATGLRFGVADISIGTGFSGGIGCRCGDVVALARRGIVPIGARVRRLVAWWMAVVEGGISSMASFVHGASTPAET